MRYLEETSNGLPVAATLTTVGDTAFVHAVAAALERGEDPIAPVGDWLAADLRVVNLETPLVSQAPVQWPRGGLRSPAAGAAICARWFDAANLANNHTMDCGAEGLTETLANLQAHGLQSFGAGHTLAAARQPLILERGGLKIGLLGASQPERDAATERDAGIRPLHPAQVLADIRTLAAQVDLVVVHLHEGYEFYEQPRPAFVAMCRAAIEAGAALVCGHHPHVPQGIERWHGRAGRRGVILYSLGNFLFDYPYHHAYPWTRFAPIATCHLSRGGVQHVDIRFARLTDRGVLIQPTEEEQDRAQQHLQALSAVLADDERRNEQAGQAVDAVVRTILQSVFQMGSQNDTASFERLLTQTSRDPYLKAFTDYARRHGPASLLQADSRALLEVTG